MNYVSTVQLRCACRADNAHDAHCDGYAVLSVDGGPLTSAVVKEPSDGEELATGAVWHSDDSDSDTATENRAPTTELLTE